MTHDPPVRPVPAPLSARRTRPFLLGAVMAALLLGASACAQAVEEPFTSNLPDEDTTAGESSTAPPEPDPGCDPEDPTPSLAPGNPSDVLSNFPADSYMAEIRDNGVLRVGVGADTLLFGFLNPQTGDIEGFDVEIARLVAEAIFNDPNRVELVPVTSAERIAAIQDGRVDLVVKTMTITCERWASINFSAVYYESGQRLLVAEDSGISSISDLADEPVCAVAGTTSLSRLQSSGITTIETPGWTECLVEFQQGRALAVSTDDTILAGLAAQDPFATVVGEPFSEEPYGIGLPQDRPEFTRYVNAVLEQAKSDGRWQVLYDRWLAGILGQDTQPPLGTYR